MELLTYIVIGLVAAVLGTKVLKTESHGLKTDIIVGAFGAYTTTTLFALLGVTGGGPVLPIVVSLVGALAFPHVLKFIPIK